MLKIKNLLKSFPYSFEPTLNKINLEIQTGEFCVIIGSNGSGKSTLFKLINGEYAADAGNVLLNSEEITSKSLYYRSQYISSVTQNISSGVVEEMTLLENMALSFMRGKKAKMGNYEVYKEASVQALKKVNLGLEKHLDKSLASLSGGQKQAVATVMAIESSPKLLLLDEHTSALDPKISKKLMEYTAESVYNHNTTCMMITHNLEDALRYGNRVIMLHKGNIVFDVSGNDKNSLKVADLLGLFHEYEDKILVTNND